MLTDEILFRQVLNGRTGALSELVARYYGPLRRFLYRLVGNNMQEAEDLVQETFIHLLRYSGPPPAGFRTWVYTVARNLAYDRYRSARYRREQAGLLGDLDEEGENWRMLEVAQMDATPEQTVLANASQDEIAAALERLPVAQREVVVLRFYEQCKLEEIAEITGAPLGTCKSRLFLGLKSLKAYLLEVAHVG